MFASRIVLNQSQIETINCKNIQRPATGLVNLLEEAESYQAEQIVTLITQEKIPQEPRYDKEGNQYKTSFYDELLERMLMNVTTDSLTLRYAVVITNSFLRTFPTMAGSYRFQEFNELDRFSITLLKLGEPVLVYCQDGSGMWSFVRNNQVFGWMLTEDLAWEKDLFRWKQYCCDREQVLVADSRRELEYIDFAGCAQKQLLLMGTRLPLYDANLHNFVIGLPAKNKKGNLVMLQLMVQRDGGYIPGPMPLSAQNIISLGKKMLGEPYGWGGAGYYRDCTSLIADIFSVFGLNLPRNSRQQLQMYGLECCKGTREEKYQYISKLPAGSILYFPGHAMLYLGRQGNQLPILHSVYAIGLPAVNEIIQHKIKRVVQGNLQQRRVNGELFLDAVTACWVPERQKKLLERF